MKYRSVLLVLALAGGGISRPSGLHSFNESTGSAARPQLSSGQHQTQQAAKSESDADAQDDVADEELAPPAVELDVSKSSPLIRQLYQATRETKEQAILASLAQAKKNSWMMAPT